MRELTVQACYALGLVRVAAARGAEPEALAAQACVDPADLAKEGSRIPFDRYVALMRAGQILTGDPALALHFGESVEVAESAIGLVIGRYAETMEEGFALMNRYARITIEVEGIGGADRFLPVRTHRGVWIVDTRRNANRFPELTESTFARMACLGRRSFGEDFVRAVHVTHERPQHASEYARVFRAPVVFGSHRNALLTGDWMAHKPPQASRLVLESLVAMGETLLAQLGNSNATRGRVESLLEPLLTSGEAGVARVSTRLGLSRQTLFRRLRAEGTTFEAVRDELRRRVAIRCLVEKGASVKQAAYAVGFSEPAAFSRAFKRWTGSSPRDYVACIRVEHPRVDAT